MHASQYIRDIKCIETYPEKARGNTSRTYPNICGIEYYDRLSDFYDLKQKLLTLSISL